MESTAGVSAVVDLVSEAATNAGEEEGGDERGVGEGGAFFAGDGAAAGSVRLFRNVVIVASSAEAAELSFSQILTCITNSPIALPSAVGCTVRTSAPRFTPGVLTNTSG